MEKMKKQNCITFCFENSGRYLEMANAVSKFINGETLDLEYIDDNISCLIYVFGTGTFLADKNKDKVEMMERINDYKKVFNNCKSFYTLINYKWRFIIFHGDYLNDEYWEQIERMFLSSGFEEI
jgi:hypothetical protein